MYTLAQTEPLIRAAIARQPCSMAEAARFAGLHYGIFRTHSTKLGLFAPSQGRKGVSRVEAEHITRSLALDDILAGLNPSYSGTRLKQRLLKAGRLAKRCGECGLGQWWNGKKLVLQLDHIDGDSNNHRINNLRLLCPNCHSQSDTYCGRGRKGVPNLRLFGPEVAATLKAALLSGMTVRQSLLSAGLGDAKHHYELVQRLAADDEELRNLPQLLQKSKRSVRTTRNPAEYQAERHAAWVESQRPLVEKLHSLKLAYEKHGWVTQAARALGKSPQKLVGWIAKVDPSFLAQCKLRAPPTRQAEPQPT